MGAGLTTSQVVTLVNAQYQREHEDDPWPKPVQHTRRLSMPTTIPEIAAASIASDISKRVSGRHVGEDVIRSAKYSRLEANAVLEILVDELVNTTVGNCGVCFRKFENMRQEKHCQKLLNRVVNDSTRYLLGEESDCKGEAFNSEKAEELIRAQKDRCVSVRKCFACNRDMKAEDLTAYLAGVEKLVQRYRRLAAERLERKDEIGAKDIPRSTRRHSYDSPSEVKSQAMRSLADDVNKFEIRRVHAIRLDDTEKHGLFSRPSNEEKVICSGETSNAVGVA